MVKRRRRLGDAATQYTARCAECQCACANRWQEHTHGFRILSATLLISEILAANISKYAAYAIRKDRDNEKYATHANSKVCVN